MPSVGMRRTTRVFGVVKGADSARVLRSGRRLWPESSEGKTKRGGDDGGDWLKPEKTSEKGYSLRRGGGVVKTAQEVVVIDTSADGVGRGMTKSKKRVTFLNETNGCDRKFGIVYSRRGKRKRLDADDDKKFGLLSGPKKRSKIGESEEGESGNRTVLSVVVNPSRRKSHWFSYFLFLVLRYIKMGRLTMEQLSACVVSEPVCSAFASQGIQFLRGTPTASTGICQFFWISGFIPLFRVDFSAVPLCFKCLYSAMHIRSMFRPFFLVNNLSVDSDVEVEIDFPEFQNKLEILCNSFEREPSDNGIVKPDTIEISDSLSLPSSFKGSRLACRNGQYANIVNPRGLPRRSSRRKHKAQHPSLVSKRRSNGSLTSDSKNVRKSHISLTGVASRKKFRSLANNCSTGSSSMMGTRGGLNSSLCSTNILVTESNKCYRIEGATVSLEKSASKEWLLTVKKDGLTICTHKAEKVMRPCSSNRITHAIMFSLDNGCKLEFVKRQNWIVFKDLYKECSHRNISAPVVKFIPVPGVREVSGYADSNSFPFHRPDAYISANGDEVSQVMTRRTANYDMDSGDEEWLSKFNEFQEHVSEDNFELLIDAFEKAYYCNPDFDEKSAVNGCRDLGNAEVVEAVFDYWMRKRKQKCSMLLRVFQVRQIKRAPIFPKPFLQKRRSFKRQPSLLGRAKRPKVLEAKQAMDENEKLRIEAAKASAKASMELAIQKRKRAQTLSENADLATYKATVLIRIAEAAQAAEYPVAEYFLE